MYYKKVGKNNSSLEILAVVFNLEANMCRSIFNISIICEFQKKKKKINVCMFSVVHLVQTTAYPISLRQLCKSFKCNGNSLESVNNRLKATDP